MSGKQDPVTPPESEHKPPFGAWWRMYAFVLAFMGALILSFILFSNAFSQ